MPREEGVRTVRPDSDLAGNHKNEKQHRRELCLVGRWMYERGHIVACEGTRVRAMYRCASTTVAS